MKAQDAFASRYRLPIYGPARLESHGRPVPLRRKALALLYFLALEGPSSRETLADLLWEGRDARTNLRAELYHLRRRTGLDPATGPRLLALPERVEPDFAPTGEALEGLEGLTPEFDAWLTRKRFELGLGRRAAPLAEQARTLAARLPVPGLWILDAPVGADASAFVEALASAKGLARVKPPHPGNPAALLHLEPPYPPELRMRELLDWPGVIALERPPFGEDPTLLLELRARYPAERARYLRVEPLRFEAARHLMNDLPFAEAARRYLAAHGRWGLLEEMLRAGLELPLKYRALYRAEARRLPRQSRLALERLSVCRGLIEPALLEQLGAAEAVEELERRRWLVFEGGWRFADPVARRALAHDLPEGLRRSYHARAARALERAGSLLAAAWHRAQAGAPLDAAELAEFLGGYAAALLTAEEETPPTVRAGAGEELPLLEQKVRGEGLERFEDRWWLLRPEHAGEPAWVEWEALDVPVLLQLDGELHVFAPLDGALDGAPPLELRAGPLRLALAPVPGPRRMGESGWLLPARGRFSVRLLLPSGTPLALYSEAPEVAAWVQPRACVARPRAGGPQAWDPFRIQAAGAPGTLRAS